MNISQWQQQPHPMPISSHHKVDPLPISSRKSSWYKKSNTKSHSQYWYCYTKSVTYLSSASENLTRLYELLSNTLKKTHSYFSLDSNTLSNGSKTRYYLTLASIVDWKVLQKTGSNRRRYIGDISGSPFGSKLSSASTASCFLLPSAGTVHSPVTCNIMSTEVLCYYN